MNSKYLAIPGRSAKRKLTPWERFFQAATCLLAIFIVGATVHSLTLPAEAASDKVAATTRETPSNPSVDTLNQNLVAVVDDTGELVVNGMPTGIWLATGTTEKWNDGVTLTNGYTFVASDKQFRLYRGGKFVASLDRSEYEADPYLHTEHCITVADDGRTVFFYDKFEKFSGVYLGKVSTWDYKSNKFVQTIDEVSVSASTYSDKYGWVWVYETAPANPTPLNEEKDVHVLCGATRTDRVLAKNAVIEGDFYGRKNSVGIRFLVYTPNRGNTIGAIYDGYTDLLEFLETGTAVWWDSYCDSYVAAQQRQGNWFCPFPHLTLNQYLAEKSATKKAA